MSLLSVEEREKRAKAIRKKLKAVEEVKEKQSAGQKLDAGQVSMTRYIHPYLPRLPFLYSLFPSFSPACLPFLLPSFLPSFLTFLLSSFLSDVAAVGQAGGGI